jgi:hypothetical protein
MPGNRKSFASFWFHYTEAGSFGIDRHFRRPVQR